MTSSTELQAICLDFQGVSAFLHVQMSVRYILVSLQSTPSVWDPCIEELSHAFVQKKKRHSKDLNAVNTSPSFEKLQASG